MRGGSARDKYGHEHSVNVQRWPIVYNQLKHDTIHNGGTCTNNGIGLVESLQIPTFQSHIKGDYVMQQVICLDI
jgi:hypothetical protein